MSQEVECPHCQWTPESTPLWNCLQCGKDLDHFESVGRCSNCGYTHENTYCPSEFGGCGNSSPHIDWYGDFEEGLAKIDIFSH